MDQPNRLRELVSLQLGDQIIKLCEQQATIDALIAENAKQKAELDELKKPDGDIQRTV